MMPMTTPRKTDTLILAAAMEKLSRDIYCEDGVATAAIAEAAERLVELSTQRDTYKKCFEYEKDANIRLEYEIKRLRRK